MSYFALLSTQKLGGKLFIVKYDELKSIHIVNESLSGIFRGSEVGEGGKLN